MRAKKRLRSLLETIDPLAGMLVEHSQRVIGQVQGEDITNYEAVIRSLSKRALKDTATARLYTRLMAEAHAKAEDVRNRVLLAAMKYKEEWGPKFKEAEFAGWRVPSILPHPEDIIIEPDGSVKYVGPTTRESQLALQEILKSRDFFIQSATMILDGPGRKTHPALVHQVYKQLRRKFYRLNTAIPPRLKKPFPRFDP